MNRTNFYTVVQVDGTDEVDFLWNPLSAFEMSYAPTYYRVTAVDTMRPDLISYKAYGTVRFWWVICLVNQIDSPLTDIQPGTVLTIPSKLDIVNFQRKFRVRRSR
jgi:nucleoid-associated protein YgaU